MIFSGFSKIHVTSGTSQDYIAQVNSVLRRNKIPGLTEIAFYSSMHNSQDVYGITLWSRFEDYQQSRPALIDQISHNIKIGRILQEHHVFKLIWERQVLTNPIGASSLNQLVFPADYSQERLDNFVQQVRHLRQELDDVRGVWVGRSLHDNHRLLIRTDWGSEQAQIEFLNSSLYKKIERIYEARGIFSEYGSTRLQLLMQPGQKENDPEAFHSKSR